MKRLPVLFAAAALGLGCPAVAEEPVVFGEIEIVVPPADKPDPNPRMHRLSPLRESLQQRATTEAAELGFDTVPLAEQTGLYGERYLVGAMGPDGGVFYVVPFLAPYAGMRGERPWDLVRHVGGEERVTACRFVLTASKLPEPSRLARGNELTALFPGPDCQPQEFDREIQAEYRASLAADGYAVFSRSEEFGEARAMLVELPNRYDSAFDIERALDLAAGERSVIRSMALFPFRPQQGFADLSDGARLYFHKRFSMGKANPRICVVEGVSWEQARSIAKRRDEGPLGRFCEDAFEAQEETSRERYRKKMEGMPPPVIRVSPVRKTDR